jgi:hypothetical protein
MNESVCFEYGGKWSTYSDDRDRRLSGYCDRDYLCSGGYEMSRERYSMNVFLITLPLGILILICGFYFFTLESVGVGLMFGGVGTMLRGIGGYWQYSPDWIRFLILLVALVVVIYFSYRFSEQLEGKKSKSKKKNGS